MAALVAHDEDQGSNGYDGYVIVPTHGAWRRNHHWCLSVGIITVLHRYKSQIWLNMIFKGNKRDLLSHNWRPLIHRDELRVHLWSLFELIEMVVHNLGLLMERLRRRRHTMLNFKGASEAVSSPSDADAAWKTREDLLEHFNRNTRYRWTFLRRWTIIHL